MLRKAFGRRLRFLRLLENLTQAALAEAVGVTEEHLGNIERGVSVPSFDLICRLATELRTHPHNLFLYSAVDLEDEEDTEAWNGMDWKQYVTRVGHWEYDPENSSFHASRSLFEILGLEPFSLDKGLDSLIGQVHQDDMPSLNDAWNRYRRGEYNLAHSFRFRRKKGDLRLGLVMGEPEKDEDGQTVMLRGVFLDVTEQKRFESTLLATRRRMEERVAERTLSLSEALARLEKEARERERAEAERERELKLRALAEAEQRIAAQRLQAYEAALEASHESFALVDRDHVYLAVNKAFLQQHNVTRDQAVGHHVREVIGREQYEIVQPYLERCLQGEAVEYTLERHVEGKGPRHMLVRYYPMTDRKGRVGRVAAFIADLTQRNQAEQRYRLIAEHSSDLIWTVDEKQRFTYLSPSFDRILGFRFELGVSVQDSLHLIPEESAEPILNLIHQRMDSIARNDPDRTAYRMKYPLYHRDGSKVWVDTLSTPIFDDTDRYLGEVGVSRDVSEREAARRALADSEERYRHLFETMAQGVIYMDDQKRIVRANPAAESILGVPLEDMIGREVSDWRWRVVYEDGSPCPTRDLPVSRALNSGEVVTGTVLGVHNPELDEHRWLRLSAMPRFRPGEDKPFQAFVTFEDITDLTRASTALEESREMYRSLFELESHALFLVDNQDLTILEVNPAGEHLFGYGREEFLGSPITRLSGEAEDVKHKVGREDTERHSRRLACKDGSLVDVEVTARFFELQGRRVHLAAMRDITEQRRLESMRRDVERIMRHELRSPAQSAVTVASLLKTDPSLSADLLEVAEQLEEHGWRMLEIMDMHNRLLQLESGAYQTGDQLLCLDELCSQALKDISRVADQAGVRVVLDLKDKNLFARGDPWLVRTALANLVKNAVEASPREGTVSVRFERENNSCVVEVENRGDIPEPIRDRMFEKYATCGKMGGQGLGCYLARLAAEAHEGSVLVADTGRGATRIQLRLPLAE